MREAYYNTAPFAVFLLFSEQKSGSFEGITDGQTSLIVCIIRMEKNENGNAGDPVCDALKL